MKRESLERIIAWNRQPQRKPLVLMGARQVGKTWLMKEFASQVYPSDAVFIDFMKMGDLAASIEGANLSPVNLLSLFQATAGKRIVPGRTLLVLDELQECPKALTSLKFFQEEMPDLAIVVAGSLLGLSMGGVPRRQNSQPAPPSSFPVGKVERLNIYPMTFLEFLEAIGKAGLAEALRQGEWLAVEALASEYEMALKQYCLTGGMPEAVATFAATHSLPDVRSRQLAILADYDDDFKKHAPSDLLPKIRLLWNNLPSQLSKENKKFIYAALKPGARAREYETALQWLDDAGMLRQVYRVSAPRLPLKACQDLGAFKLYLHDVGLLGALSGLPIRTILERNALFTNFKGSLTEQYVLGELIAAGYSPCYWTAENGNAEVDFIIQSEDSVVPLEVKAATNTKAKSLAIYRESFRPNMAVKCSLRQYHRKDGVLQLPLYALGACLRTEIDRKE